MNNVDNMGIAGPAVNPFSYPSEICSECGSEVFVPGVIMKKVPGVLLGEGGVEFIPVRTGINSTPPSPRRTPGTFFIITPGTNTSEPHSEHISEG